MNRKMAESLSQVLGGDAEIMPQDRQPGVTLTLPDGRFVAIETETYGPGAGWRYPSRAAYDRWNREGVMEDAPDYADWENWGLHRPWANALASLIGGTAHQSGGNVWVVLFDRADGKFALIGDGGAEVYNSREHYDTYYDGPCDEPQYIDWE